MSEILEGEACYEDCLEIESTMQLSEEDAKNVIIHNKKVKTQDAEKALFEERDKKYTDLISEYISHYKNKSNQNRDLKMIFSCFVIKVMQSPLEKRAEYLEMLKEKGEQKKVRFIKNHSRAA